MERFFADYLERLESLHTDMKKAIKGFSAAALDWTPAAGMNSLCVLVVHTAGAERYWIGDVACQDLSGRNRESEFEARDFHDAQLADRLDRSLIYAGNALENLRLEDLREKRVSPRDNREFTAGWALAHALEHTALHLGHAQMTRQLWKNQA